VNGLKKCLCMRSSDLVFTQSKRKKHVKGLKKMCLYALSCGGTRYTDELLWKIETEFNYPV